MRQRVQDLVSEFLARTWTGAAQGIAINGQDAMATMAVHQHNATTTMTTVDVTAQSGSGGGGGAGGGGRGETEGVDFEYEAYDARLSGKVAGLYAELEALTTQVSRLRRTAPGASAERDGRGLVEGLEKEEEGEEVEVVGVERPVLKLEGVREGWEEDVGAVWERGLGELRRLGGQAGSGSVGDGRGRGSLTETVGKVQRAKVVATELE